MQKARDPKTSCSITYIGFCSLGLNWLIVCLDLQVAVLDPAELAHAGVEDEGEYCRQNK